MATRVWEWQLATGENVIAKRDSVSGMESVFVGPRLVSRAVRASMPAGHPVRLRGAVDGPYRRPNDVRVCFDGDECRLVVDGEVRTPRTTPPSGPSRLDQQRIARFQRRRAIFVGLILCLVGVFALAVWKNGGFGTLSADAAPWGLAFVGVFAVAGVYGAIAMRCPRCRALVTTDEGGFALLPTACRHCDQRLS